MKWIKIFILSLIISLSHEFSMAQVTLEWTATYDYGGLWDYARAMCVDSLGNIYLTGESAHSFVSTDYDYATVKFNSNGDILWSRRFDFTTSDRGLAITSDQHNNVYVTGSSGGQCTTLKYNSEGEELWQFLSYSRAGYDIAQDDSGYIYIAGDRTSYNIFLLKLSPEGEMIWDITFVDSTFQNSSFSKMICKYDKIFICGTVLRDDSYLDAVILAYNSDGTIFWNNYFNGTDNLNDKFNSITIDSHNSVLAVGTSQSVDRYNGFLSVKYSFRGGVAWIRTHNFSEYEDKANIVITDGEDNIFVGGSSARIINNSGFSSFRIIKYNSNGDLLWTQEHFSSEIEIPKLNYMSIDDEANIYCVGPELNNGDFHILLAKFSSNGELIYDFTYPTVNNYAVPSGLIVLENDNILVAGYKYETITPMDYLLLKYSDPSAIQDVSNNISYFNLSQNFPNPFNPNSKIKFEIPEFGLTKLSVYDVLGRELLVLLDEELNKGNYEKDFDGSDFPSGIYFYKLEHNNSSITKKMILLK